MKTLMLGLLCGMLAAQVRTVKPEDLCTVEGRVLNAATGTPLGDVKLRLKPTGAQSGASIAFVTMSDEKGNFAFAGIEPGTYRFSAERLEYTTAIYGERRSNAAGTPIALEPAARKTGFEFKLKPQGVITGRVLGPDGEPLKTILNTASGVEAPVSAMRVVYENGRRSLRFANIAGVQNDLGEYRIGGLEPGRYYISATPLKYPGFLTGALDLSGLPPQSYQATYYPSATSLGEATPLDVTAGSIVTGADIRMIRSEAFPVHVTVVDQTGLNLGTLTLVQQPPGGFGTGVLQGAGAMRGPRAQYDLGLMPRGRIPVRVMAYNPQGPALWSRYVLDVNGPVDNLEFAVKPGFTVQGRLTVDNAPVPKGLKFSLTMPDLPSEAKSTTKPAEPAPDGSFVFTNVSADRYSVDISGMPRGFYLKSVRLGSQDALDTDLDLTQAPERPLEIVLSANPGALGGLVTSADGAPVSGAVVAVVPQSAQRRQRPDWYRAATTDAGGKFAMADLRPGDYKLFAWEDVEDGAWMDPVFLKPFEEKGQPLTVREGVSGTVELKPIQ